MICVVSRLGLRLAVPAGCELGLDQVPVLQILVDGQDMLAVAPAEGGRNYGWHPEELRH